MTSTPHSGFSYPTESLCARAHTRGYSGHFGSRMNFICNLCPQLQRFCIHRNVYVAVYPVIEVPIHRSFAKGAFKNSRARHISEFFAPAPHLRNCPPTVQDCGLARGIQRIEINHHMTQKCLAMYNYADLCLTATILVQPPEPFDGTHLHPTFTISAEQFTS